MPFGKCHAFGLSLVDFFAFVNCVCISLTFYRAFKQRASPHALQVLGDVHARRLNYSSCSFPAICRAA